MRRIRSARQRILMLLTRLRIEAGDKLMAGVHDIDDAIRSELEVMVGVFVFPANVPRGDARLCCRATGWRWRHKLRPLQNGIIHIGVDQTLDDRSLGVRIEPAKAVHTRQHRRPVDGLLGRSERHSADLMTIHAKHLEVQLVAHAVEFQHGKRAAGRPLILQVHAGRRSHLDDHVL